MTLPLRPALPSDIHGLFYVRTAVVENALTAPELEALGITEEAVAEMISASPCAWVVTEAERIVGFSMIIPEDACLFAAFVLPEFEGRGIGKRLVSVAEAALFDQHRTIWLETGMDTRAADFYRYLGWHGETPVGEGDIRLEKHRP